MGCTIVEISSDSRFCKSPVRMPSKKAMSWRIIVLNSECAVVGCGTNSAQYRWLTASLASARAAGEPDWLQLTALIHDMGKAMFLWGCAADGQEGSADGAQWALGGDTWVVGCRIPDSAVHAEFNALNADMAAGAATASACGV
jgi:hypothetical protein